MQEIIIKRFKESADLKTAFAQKNCERIIDVVHLIAETLRSGNKIMLFGNGGSAADAQHLAAELVGRFRKERLPLAALALSTNTSSLTAIGNDYGFDKVFSRQIAALAKKEDIVVGISTSGSSQNVITAVNEAKKLGIPTIGLLGKNGGELKDIVDTALIIKTDDTPRIQEMHILAGHIICEIIETTLST